MKLMKDGRVKLEENEVRVGNFFVKREKEHLKITDLNGVFSFRAHAKCAVGIWLDNMWIRAMRENDASARQTLHTYIATMWSFHSVAPDDEYIKDALVATDAALNRHPDWYGIKKDATDEEHAEAAREVEEIKEFEADVRKVVESEREKGDGAGGQG